jgi:hypothetical protein
MASIRKLLLIFIKAELVPIDRSSINTMITGFYGSVAVAGRTGGGEFFPAVQE